MVDSRSWFCLGAHPLATSGVCLCVSVRVCVCGVRMQLGVWQIGAFGSSVGARLGDNQITCIGVKSVMKFVVLLTGTLRLFAFFVFGSGVGVATDQWLARHPGRRLCVRVRRAG